MRGGHNGARATAGLWDFKRGEDGFVQAAAPHPRPAKRPASALSPQVDGERGTGSEDTHLIDSQDKS